MQSDLLGGTYGQQNLLSGVAGFVFSETRHAKGLSLPRHAHARASVNLVLGGGYQECFRGAADTHAASTLIFKPEGESHSNDFREAAAHCLLIEVSQERLRDISDCSAVLAAPQVQVGGPASGPAFAIVKELREPDQLSPLALEAAVLSLLLNAGRQASAGGAAPEALRRLERVREVLHEVSPSDLNLTHLANLVEMRPAVLARAFKAAFGVTISRYARRIQVDRALSLLTRSDRPLAAIATQTGFYDQSHMTRVLRRELGLTPRVIRRSARS